MGFYRKEGNVDGSITYLQDPWNQLDFVVVLSSWLNVIVEYTQVNIGIDVSTLRAMRILRVLRSLRFLAGIRTILSTIGQAVPYSANVMAFLGFMFVVCGIIGVQMFRGTTAKRCEYGSMALQAYLQDNKFPMSGNISQLGNAQDQPIPFDNLNFMKVTDMHCRREHVAHSFAECAAAAAGLGMAVTTPIDDNLANSADKPTGCYYGDGKLYWNSAANHPHVLGFTGDENTGKCTVKNPCLCKKAPIGSYEYPIGIGIWYTYCRVDQDCPLYNTNNKWNLTQTCVPCENPGKAFQHYDSILDAWVALFINMANLYWWETAHRISDSNSGLGSNIAWGYGLFNVFMLTYVSVNMFVAVITTVFMDVRSAENPTGGMSAPEEEEVEDEEPRKWSKPFYFVAALGGEGPYIEEAKEDPKQRKGIIHTDNFDQFILAIIFINTYALASEQHVASECKTAYPTAMCQSEQQIFIAGIAEYCFNFIFFVEMWMKILGMGFLAYIRPAFNKLDFFIVVTSTLDMVGKWADSGGGGMEIFKLFRVFRLFRVLRVARVLYKNENLKRVLITVFGSGGALANLFLFIIFSVGLFAILGMHLFGGKYNPENTRSELFGDPYGDNSGSLLGRLVGDGTFMMRTQVDKKIWGYEVTDFIRRGLIPRRNFEDFPRAFLLSFQVMTGDDWVNQLNDHMQVVNGWLPPILFFFNFAFCNFILLSLFIAVILENFEVAEAEKMKLQVEARKKAEEEEERAKTKPKVTFVHRIVWLFRGEGHKEGSIWSFHQPPNTDPENGLFLPGDKWYNDDNSLFMFGPDNMLRKQAMWLSENAIFDTIVLVAILLGTFMLAWEGPKGSLGGVNVAGLPLKDIFEGISFILYLIFLFELGVKCIAYGFFFTPNAYIKSPWNKLDFTVVVGSTITWLGGEAGLVSLLRCLRPLRIINRNEGMRVIISAVTDSLAVNMGVLALAGMGLLIFGILGTTLFGGKFYSCNCQFVYPDGVTPFNSIFNTEFGQYTSTLVNATTNATYTITGTPTVTLDKQMCIGDKFGAGETVRYGVDPTFPDAIAQCYWDNRPYNFDTCIAAMQSLFTASTLAGWTDIMEIAMDIVGFDMQPIPFQSSFFSVYFVFYVFIMSFFVTNLFVGVLIDFIGHSDGTALLTEEQQKVIDMNKFQRMHRPEKPPEPPSNPFRRWMYGLVESNFWSNFSNAVIIFNVIIMAMERQGIDGTDLWDMLELLNFICLVFFTVECAFKIIGYFPAKYWSDAWNRFDFIVVTISWAAIIFDLGSVQAVRAMRAIRIVLVLKNAKGIRSLFNTLILSIYPAANISVLLGLLYALYAILGMQVFGHSLMQDPECAMNPASRVHQLYYEDASNTEAGVWTPSFAGHSAVKDSGDDFERLWYCNVGLDGATTNSEHSCAAKNGGFGTDTCHAHFNTTSAYGAIAGGLPGHMLMGSNRQYTHHASFHSFGAAMTLLFQCAAGQDWKFVMYAVGGEPGQPSGQQGTAFLYFFSFFFFSNYILMNLFVAVILDNFAASMREQELDISEEDVVFFKYCYRAHSSDATPEIIPYYSLWHLVADLSKAMGHDDSGEEIENPFSPAIYADWDKGMETAWKLAVPRDRETIEPDEIKPFLESLFDEGNSPIDQESEPGETFEEWWDVVMHTPAFHENAQAEIDDPNCELVLEDEENVFGRIFSVRTWEDYRFYMNGLLDVNAVEPIAIHTTIKDMIKSLRFRSNYHHVVNELEFHSAYYVDTNSTLRYNQVLQALVNVKMGKEALSLEDQLARGVEVSGPVVRAPVSGDGEDAEDAEENDDEGDEGDDDNDGNK